MKKYLGVKLIEAKPMISGDFVKYCNEKLQRPYSTSFKHEYEGYLVKYNDGYESWCPKPEFEMAYTEINDATNLTQEKCKKLAKTWCESDNKTEFKFGIAIELMKSGNQMSRRGWNGKGMWIELQIPDEHSKMTRPYMYHVSTKGSTKHYGDDVKELERIPWLPSNTDILADDWYIVKPIGEN